MSAVLYFRILVPKSVSRNYQKMSNRYGQFRVLINITDINQMNPWILIPGGKIYLLFYKK